MATKSRFQQCIDVISSSSEKAITSEQAQSLVQRIMDHIERTKGSEGANAEAQIADIGRQIIEQDKLMSAIQKRNAYLTVVSQRRIKDYVKNFSTPGEGLRAFMNGSSKTVKEGRNSVYYQGVALRDKHIGQLKDGLERMDLIREFKSGEIDKQIFQEMYQLNRDDGRPGISGSAKAQKIAALVNKVNLEMIDRENRAGAFVRPLEGYIMRQTHDPDTIRRAGGMGYNAGSNEASFKVWSQFILPLLDQKKTFINADDPVKFLRSAHEGIISGVHDKHTDANIDINADFSSTGALARKVSQPRVLHFKDAESAYAYNQKFGVKDFKEAVIRQIQTRSRAIALMENFGPNPDRTFDRIVHDLKLGARAHPEDARHMASLNDWKIEASYNELTGANDIPSNPSLARMSAVVRTISNLSKLGGATITAIADKGFFHSEMTYQGMRQAEVMAKQFSMFAPHTPEGRSSLNLMGAAVDGFIGNVVSRFSLHDNKAGTMYKLQQKFFQLNGMNHWNDIHKGAAAELMAAHLAEHSNLRDTALPAELKKTLSLYGIEGKVWDIIRQAKDTVNDREYITPDALSKVPDDKIREIMSDRKMADTANNISRVRDEIDTKLRTYMADRVDIAVPTPGNDEKVYAHWNTQSGTPMGEAVRMVMLFKSMPITVLRKVMSREVYGHGSDTILKWLQNDRTGNFRMAQIIAMTTLGGYLSGAIKDALKGRTPKDPTNVKTVEDALLRGGGLGIYGDFLFSEYDRSYRSALATAAGPVVGQLDNVADIFSKLKQGENVSNETGKLLLNNTPFVNLFYIRPVLDYLVLWNLQEMTDPGSLYRQERKVQQNNGQGFFIRPSEEVHK